MLHMMVFTFLHVATYPILNSCRSENNQISHVFLYHVHSTPLLEPYSDLQQKNLASKCLQNTPL